MIPKLLTALLFIGLNFYAFNYLGRALTIPERVGFEAYPDTLDTWQCQGRQDLDEKVIRNLGVTDYLLCDYARPESGGLVNFYVGYHEKQTRSDSGKETLIHPPEHCLPGSGWDIVESDIVPVDFGIPGEAKRVTIARGNLRQRVYFWYQSRGRVIARDHLKILHMFADRALTGRTDGALVRVTIPIDKSDGGKERADETFREFAMRAMPPLDAGVPR